MEYYKIEDAIDPWTTEDTETKIKRTMAILYSSERIDPKNYCEFRFIAYQKNDVEQALNMAIQALGVQLKEAKKGANNETI